MYLLGGTQVCARTCSFFWKVVENVVGGEWSVALVLFGFVHIWNMNSRNCGSANLGHVKRFK